MPRLRGFVAAALVACTPLVACSGANSTTPLVENVDRVTAATEEGDFAALVANADAAWERRSEREAVQEAIDSWEQATRVPTPEGVDRNEALYPVYVNLSLAYYWMGHAHVRFDPSPDEALIALYQQGMEYGQTAIALNNEQWTRALLYETPIPEAVSTLTVDDVPAVYWYASNLGRWGIMRGIATVLANVDDLKAMMMRIEELDPTFFYDGPDRYFGVYYTKLPFGNPDLEQSRQRFERAIEMFPEYLESRVLFAEEYGVITQNRELTEEHLRTVVETDISQWPELLPENANAQRRAQLMLDEIDEYFR